MAGHSNCNPSLGKWGCTMEFWGFVTFHICCFHPGKGDVDPHGRHIFSQGGSFPTNPVDGGILRVLVFPKSPTLWLCLTVCYWKLWFISWHFPLNMVIFDSFLYVYQRVIFPNCIPIYPHLVRISLEWVTTKKCLGCTPNWKPIISPFWVYISSIYLVYPHWIILNKFESS